jgi:hypothetical protein
MLVAASCAESDVESNIPESGIPESSVIESASDGSSSSSVTPGTVETGDFGARYNGSPVAFWFWAPY